MKVDNLLVSIIIVNYKDYSYLYRCLESLHKTIYPNTEIIVVDNESDPAALDKLNNKFKDTHFFALKENLNYAEGNNYGIAKSKGDFIVLLNNDTVVENNWLEPLVEEGLNNPRAFYQPLILLLDRPDYIFSIGCAINPLGIAFPIGIGKHISEISIPKEKAEVFYCVGACIFTSKQTIYEVGGFDSNYWTYYEDVNLGWKGKLHGIPSFIVPSSTIYHKWGGTYGQKLSPRKLYLLERGRYSSILRNYSVRSIVIISAVAFVFDLAILVFLLPRHMAMAKIHASLDVLKNLGPLIKDRKKVQQARVKKDGDICKHMSTYIEHPLIGRIPNIAQKLLVWVSELLIEIL
jgi:GT2 family glycosyltransferase